MEIHEQIEQKKKECALAYEAVQDFESTLDTEVLNNLNSLRTHYDKLVRELVCLRSELYNKEYDSKR